MLQPTQRQYSELENAYDHFNTTLFNGTLPRCLITLQRKGKSTRGFFSGKRFITPNGDQVTDEIALNPALFRHRTTEQTLSTLVHEMVHLWQHHHGTPSRSTYHNKEWADHMDSLGLIASSTGEPGGRRTGQQVTHYIQEGGPFAKSCAELLQNGFILPWVERLDEPDRKKAESKTKFTCPICQQNAWGKPDLEVLCGVHKVTMMAPTSSGMVL
jgi:predicted SprT family Zn-dependent metalloprotease